METSRVGPIVRAISQACVLVCILSFTSGCREYSKEQQREIDAIKRRVTENPASIDHDDGHGTPLEVATLNGYLDLAQWLVSHRADVNAPDHDEGTVLHYAAVVGHSPKLDILRFLLSKGANVDARRKGTETPLHVAVFLGRADVVTVLLEHGADVHARGYFGQTPMHLSRASRKVIQSSSRSYWHTVQTSMSARTTRLRHFTWRPWEATLRLLRCYLIVEPTFAWRTQRAQLLCTMPHNPAIVTLPRFCWLTARIRMRAILMPIRLYGGL